MDRTWPCTMRAGWLGGWVRGKSSIEAQCMVHGFTVCTSPHLASGWGRHHRQCVRASCCNTDFPKDTANDGTHKRCERLLVKTRAACPFQQNHAYYLISDSLHLLVRMMMLPDQPLRACLLPVPLLGIILFNKEQCLYVSTSWIQICAYLLMPGRLK